jgi:hypothetical protein
VTPNSQMGAQPESLSLRFVSTELRACDHGSEHLRATSHRWTMDSRLTRSRWSRVLMHSEVIEEGNATQIDQFPVHTVPPRNGAGRKPEKR